MLLKRAIKRRKLPGSDVVTLFPIRALSHVSGIASCSVVRKRWLRAREGWREIEGSFLDQRVVFQPTVHRFSIVRLFLFLSFSIFFPQTKFPNFRRGDLELLERVIFVIPLRRRKRNTLSREKGGAILPVRRNVVPFEESGSTTSVQISSCL